MRDRRTTVLTVLLLAVAAVALTGCAAGAPDVAAAATQPRAGFWLGLWHGLICPIAFIVSLFDHHVGLYEVHNVGGWYDLGFVLGLSISFGGPARSRPRRDRRPVDPVRHA